MPGPLRVASPILLLQAGRCWLPVLYSIATLHSTAHATWRRILWLEKLYDWHIYNTIIYRYPVSSLN